MAQNLTSEKVPSQARILLSKVFEFLKSLNESRHPVPREILPENEPLWIDAWPRHPFIEVRRGDHSDENDNEADSEAEPEPVIRVRRAKLTECPKPPQSLDGWLEPGWHPFHPMQSHIRV